MSYGESRGVTYLSMSGSFHESNVPLSYLHALHHDIDFAR